MYVPDFADFDSTFLELDWRSLLKRAHDELKKIESFRFFCLDAAWLYVGVVRAVTLLTTNGEKIAKTLDG